MVKEIRIYVEGGGVGKEARNQVRQGFSEFFKELKELARAKKIKWEIIVCGPRGSAYEDFNRALKTHPEAFNILLVDAEYPVTTTPWQHLNQYDSWLKPVDAKDENCHLMVIMIEAWLLADTNALKNFYGAGFQVSSIPKISNVEQIPKARIEASLKTATRNTKKGEYHKIQHCPKILEIVDSNKVRKASRHCDRLFTVVAGKLK